MAKITKHDEVTEVKVIEPEKIVMELTIDEAEAVLGALGFVTTASEVDTMPIYRGLRDALGHREVTDHKYKAVLTEHKWSIELVRR